MNVSPKNADGTPIGGNITSPSFDAQPTKYPEPYTCDVSYKLTAVPNAAAGYKFVGWTGDNTSTATTITISVSDGPKSVVANFAFKPEAISMADARELMNRQPGPLLLDVSSEDNFNNSHILCARNYPWSALRKQFDVGIANLNPYKTNTILMYDQTGARSKAAAEYLAERGFVYIKYMTAGLDEWMAAGYDTYVPGEDADICTSLAPMAHAGNAQTVNEGVRVNLDGSGSTDPGGGLLTYEWSQFKGSPGVTLTGADKDRASFTSPFLTSGDAELVFHLTVTNSAGQTHTDSTIVNIVWFNDPPVADAGGDQTVETGKKVTLDGSGSNDPEGQSLSYRWRRSGGTLYPSLSNDTDIAPTFTAPNTSGYVEFTLTVTDNGGKTHTDRVSVTVQPSTPTNISPEADAAADSTSVSPGETVTLDGSGSSDPDGTIAAYAWEQTDATGKTVALMPGSTAVKPTFTAPDVTETTILRFTLMVTDNDDAIDTDTVEITVNKPVENQAPTAVAAANKTSVSPGETVTLDGSGSSDPDGTIAAYAWEQTDATAVALKPGSTAIKPTFTAPEVTETITLIFKLTVTDNNDATATSTVRVTVAKPSGGGSGGGCFIHTLEEGI